MLRDFIHKHQFALKWLGIAFIIKLGLFVYFAINFYKNTPADLVTNFIFIYSGDTTGYYDPMESFVNGTGYDSFCRMPGLLPIYAILRLFFSTLWAKTFMVVLQFLTGVVSVYILALIAKLIFKKDKIFYITFFLYSFSSFVSIWDHFGYADSFSTSFLIFSIYFVLKYKSVDKIKYLFVSGLFIAWSIFIRPILGIVLPLVILLYLFDIKNLLQTFKTVFLYSLPLVIFISMWTYRNYVKTKRIIVLQGPLAECFPGITEELLSVRGLIVAWGGDTQPWSKNSDGEWFFSLGKRNPEPQSRGIYTTAYNLDSLNKLRKIFHLTLSDSLSAEEKNVFKKYVREKSKIYIESYKSEHFLKYFIFSKLILLKRFVLPTRLDNLPFPKLSEMSIFQKLFKGGYLLLLLFVNIFGLIGCFIALRKKILLPIIPLAFVFMLATVLGYVEQRYLVPAYSFFIIFAAVTINSLLEFIKNKNLKKRSLEA